MDTMNAAIDCTLNLCRMCVNIHVYKQHFQFFQVSWYIFWQLCTFLDNEIKFRPFLINMKYELIWFLKNKLEILSTSSQQYYYGCPYSKTLLSLRNHILWLRLKWIRLYCLYSMLQAKWIPLSNIYNWFTLNQIMHVQNNCNKFLFLHACL